jgi:hypothetical protein
MSQTKERRIFLHWKALKRTHDYRRGEPDTVYMRLARRWHMPIKDVKQILEVQRGE